MFSVPMYTTIPIYKEESINMSQMNIKCKTCDIRIWEKQLFLDISSTNTEALVPSLYQCIETHSTEVFDCLLSHFHTSLSTSSSSAKCLPPRRFLAHQRDGSH
jgi:prephenate dehydratase